MTRPVYAPTGPGLYRTRCGARVEIKGRAESREFPWRGAFVCSDGLINDDLNWRDDGHYLGEADRPFDIIGPAVDLSTQAGRWQALLDGEVLKRKENEMLFRTHEGRLQQRACSETKWCSSPWALYDDGTYELYTEPAPAPAPAPPAPLPKVVIDGVEYVPVNGGVH